MSAPALDPAETRPRQSRLAHLPTISAARRLPLILGGGVFLGSLLLYLATLAPSVVTLFDDSLEFQLVTYQLGIAHPTGYPLYTLLGKLFTLLPVGNVAYRVNLMSAIFGAATAALLYGVIVQMMQGRMLNINDDSTPSRPPPARGRSKNALPGGLSAHVGGIIGGLSLAVSPVFWQQATIAEVYTLNAFFVALILLIATRPLADDQHQGRIWALAFLAGLSLTHHRTMLLLFPAVGIYLLLIHRRELLAGKTVGLAILLGVLPLLLYLYLPLRGHMGSLDGTYDHSWAGFWRQVSGGGYGTFLFDNPFDHERDATFYWALFSRQFFTLIPGLLGAIYLLLARRRLFSLTAVALVSYLGFNLFYQVTDIEVFFIPIFLIWAIWSGLGVAVLLRLVSRLHSPVGRGLGWGLILLIAAVGLGATVQQHRATITEGYTWQVHDYGLDILQQPLPAAQSTIIGIVGEMTLVRYFQQTVGLRPDVETIAADVEADRLAAVEQALGEGQTVYLTRPLPGAAERWSLNGVGPLIRVDPTPVTVPPPASGQTWPNQPLTDQITLLGYEFSRPPHTGQGVGPVRLTLFWQANGDIGVDLKVSARLLGSGSGGESVAVVDGVPVHFAYPTPAWRPGEVIADVYTWSLPPTLAAGAYTPLLIWYDPAQNGAEVGRLTLEPVWVE